MTRDSVRLSVGDLRGVRLPVPEGVRPTTGRVREALMSSWQTRLPEADLLELFAGSGAVGLEALERGARRVLALEADPRVIEELDRTYTRWSGGRARVRRALLPVDLRKMVGSDRFDLVFADPPYDFSDLPELLTACATVLQPLGELAVEHSKRVTAPEEVPGLRLARSRRYGETDLSFYAATREDGNAG